MENYNPLNHMLSKNQKLLILQVGDGTMNRARDRAPSLRVWVQFSLGYHDFFGGLRRDFAKLE